MSKISNKTKEKLAMLGIIASISVVGGYANGFDSLADASVDGYNQVTAYVENAFTGETTLENGSVIEKGLFSSISDAFSSSSDDAVSVVATVSEEVKPKKLIPISSSSAKGTHDE